MIHSDVDITIRSEAELRRAVVVLGLALSAPVNRKGFWRYGYGESSDVERAQAHMAFAALGWVIGADATIFRDLLLILEFRLREFGFPIPELREAPNGN